ncbi:hypothetical protein P7C73_g2454, partial [Tremellales sp. Uapishka_1]
MQVSLAMSPFSENLRESLRGDEDAAADLTAILDHQVAALPLGSVPLDEAFQEWTTLRSKIDAMLDFGDEDSLAKAVKIFAKIAETLELFTPSMKGLTEIHSYTCEKLESVVFDQKMSDETASAAAFLYGHAMSMSPMTEEAVVLAVENILGRRQDQSITLALCILLGVEKANSALFETNLPILLKQVQAASLSSKETPVAQESLRRAMYIYTLSERAGTCRSILQTTHAVFASNLKRCEDVQASDEEKQTAVEWCCFLIQNTPMQLRLDLISTYPATCSALSILEIFSKFFHNTSPQVAVGLCGALPVLTTWSTTVFCGDEHIRQLVDFMLRLGEGANEFALNGLGELAAVVLDWQQAAQRLLGRLLASLGPVTMDVMVGYLQCPSTILLSDVQLLEMIACLLPNLSRRIIQTMMDIVDDLLIKEASEGQFKLSLYCSIKPERRLVIEGRHEAVLEALSIFPLDDPELAVRAQKLVLWSLDENQGKSIVMASLQLATNPRIATPQIMRTLTFKAAQLLLADGKSFALPIVSSSADHLLPYTDSHIVHVALSALSNPALASMLDERSCSMILLALHQSLEPSIQIVAAKLLTHLTTAHRAIVQPLAWSHIRQSLSLMDFLHSVDPTRAIIEACIISNLLPALPLSLHRKYVGPVKELILSGLQRPKEGHTLSLIFQGLANLAKFEGWGSVQQSELALDLLEMAQEIPKDSQHAALNAISRLLSVPQEGLDVYDILITVHATFGGRQLGLDEDSKALVSGIYGHLGTVERNPVISRDSKAAINRETSVYTTKQVHLSQVAEVRDKSNAISQTHINWLVTKSLLSNITPSHRSSNERALILEVMTSLGILQPQSIATLIPELPSLILGEMKLGLGTNSDTRKESTPVAASLLFLASALHTSPLWLSQYWRNTAEIMMECITAGECLPVLRGLDVMLTAIDN